MNTEDAATLWGISAHRVRELCKQGRIPGAKLIGGRVWILPNQPTITPGTRGPKRKKVR